MPEGPLPGGGPPLPPKQPPTRTASLIKPIRFKQEVQDAILERKPKPVTRAQVRRWVKTRLDAIKFAIGMRRKNG